jgi:hypothetical protein
MLTKAPFYGRSIFYDSHFSKSMKTFSLWDGNIAELVWGTNIFLGLYKDISMHSNVSTDITLENGISILRSTLPLYCDESQGVNSKI